MNKNKDFVFMILVVISSLFFVLTYKHFVDSPYLNFSDAAKVGDVARNLYETGELKRSFTFFSTNPDFSIKGIPILNPLITFLSFKIFGVNDFAVVAPSMLFFILSGITIYFLGKKIASPMVGFLASLAFSSNPDMLVYATNGATESLFIFEILLSLYLVAFRKNWADFLAVIIAISMYFTRPQGFIFIFATILFWLILKIGVKKALVGVTVIATLGTLFDRLVLYPLSFNSNLYSITARAEQAILHYPADQATSDDLRGGNSQELTYVEVGKKVFYNIYNFYKFTPQILSPYILVFFVIGLLVKEKNVLIKGLKIVTLISFFVLTLSVSLTIPLIRYIHPVLPLIYLLGVVSLVDLMKKNKLYILHSTFYILLFVVIPTLGIIFLDSRYFDRNVNPPVYRDFAFFLKEHTQKVDIVITNLDTWGSWYGERKTIWYPLTLDQALKSQENFDVIYLTTYKIDDQNYYMDDDWRKILSGKRIPDGYKLEARYENGNDKAVLLKKI